MTECERLVEDKFIKDDLIKLYIRYADEGSFNPYLYE